MLDLVALNTTLEILEVDASITKFRNVIPCGMGRALECDRALEETRFRLGFAADFKELVLLLVPDANGHQANTTLSTLELSLVPFYASPLDYMTDFAKLVASYSTLTDVRVSRELEFLCDPALRKSFIQKTMVEVSKLRGELERMVDNELRQNTSLRSLMSVGEWELHRGNCTQEWQIVVTEITSPSHRWYTCIESMIKYSSGSSENWWPLNCAANTTHSVLNLLLNNDCNSFDIYSSLCWSEYA